MKSKAIDASKPAWQSHSPLPPVMTIEAQRIWLASEAKWIRATSPGVSEADAAAGAAARWDFLAERLAGNEGSRSIRWADIQKRAFEFDRKLQKYTIDTKAAVMIGLTISAVLVGFIFLHIWRLGGWR